MLETTFGIGLQYLPTNPSPTSPPSYVVNLHIYVSRHIANEMPPLLALSIGQRLCVNFYVSIRANFLSTLRLHLNITCSCSIWFILF